MYNLLLDAMPEEYEGYLIRTDYRIGIQIAQALDDPELEQNERFSVALSLLYGGGIPPLQTAIDGLRWFLSAGAPTEEEQKESASSIQYFSFDFDSARLYSGFRRIYGIDLDKVNMHWFRFLALLSDLGDCAFTRVIDFRSADISHMDKHTKKAYLAMRKKFALPSKATQEESEFLEKLNASNK